MKNGKWRKRKNERKIKNEKKEKGKKVTTFLNAAL